MFAVCVSGQSLFAFKHFQGTRLILHNANVLIQFRENLLSFAVSNVFGQGKGIKKIPLKPLARYETPNNG